MMMSIGIKQGRVVETKFGRISDATLNIGKYHLQMIILLVSIVFGKGFYLIGVFVSVVALTLFYQSPVARFLAWKKSWFSAYFYGHLVLSMAVGVLLSMGEGYVGWGMLWILLNIIFGWVLMKGVSGDFEELMKGNIKELER